MSTIPRLSTERLLLREFQTADRAPFAAVNADPRVTEMLSRALTREESDAFADTIERHWCEVGFGLWALERLDSGTFIGFTGLSIPTWAPVPGVEIGWRLAPGAWGLGFATEAARETLRFAFEDLGLTDLVSFTAAVNTRSRAVMARLGMVHDPASDFAHPRLPADHPLSPHVTYRLSRGDWQR